MHFVIARTNGVWLKACDTPNGYQKGSPPVFLVQGLEGTFAEPVKWCVNGDGVEMEAGLVVGFQSEADANHFIESNPRKAPRATRLHVADGDIIAFHDQRHASHFIAMGVAEFITREQAVALYAQRQNGVAPESEPEPGPEVETVVDGAAGTDAGQAHVGDGGSGSSAPAVAPQAKPKGRRKLTA